MGLFGRMEDKIKIVGLGLTQCITKCQKLLKDIEKDIRFLVHSI